MKIKIRIKIKIKKKKINIIRWARRHVGSLWMQFALHHVSDWTNINVCTYIGSDSVVQDVLLAHSVEFS